MSRGRQAQAIKLSREDRKSPELLNRRGGAEHRQVKRRQIALMCHAAASTTAIADTVGVSAQTVSHRRTRLARQGLKGLDEVARPGRPRRIGASPRLELLSLASEPAEPQGRATPTLGEWVERAVERGVVTQISRRHLQRILQAGDPHPHRARQWLNSPDPLFPEKVNAICALYRQAPKGAVVLSVDEKTGKQAIERKHADRLPVPGRLRRREFEYIRHGTQALIAAMDVHSEPAHGSRTDRRTEADLVASMEQVAQACPKGRVHSVWDNLNTHRAQAVRDDFNARHDHRFVFHFTPIHANWVNQIELMFGIYPCRVLRHAGHASIQKLHQRTDAFMAQRNRVPKPFKWTFAGFELQTGEPLRFKHHAHASRSRKGR